MKEDFLSTIKSKEFWTDLLVMDLFTCLVLLLHIKWHTMVFCSLIAAVGLYRIRSMDDKRERDICNRVIRHVKKAGRQSKQKGDPYILYKAIDECLPEMHKLLPNKLYKYFPLTDEKTDEMRLSSIKDDVIWGSIPSQFNDPFEAKSMYLKGGIALIILAVLLVPSLGKLSAKAKRKYPIISVDDALYAVILIEADRCLVQPAIVQEKQLRIDTSSFRYYNKNAGEIWYQQFEDVAME